MKILNRLSAITILFALVSFKQPNTANKISVVINDLRNSKGKCIVYLYNNENGFPSNPKKALKTIASEISNGKAQVTFDNVVSGTYAISVLHDENSNGVMDKNFMGMPKEGYGVSNNNYYKLKAATFEESKFSINGNEKKIIINCHY